MQKSLQTAHISTFISLVVAIRWAIYLRSRICGCEAYSESLIEASRKAVSFVGDVFLTRDDINDKRARLALHDLMNASSEDVAREERCLQGVEFPAHFTQLAVLCGKSLKTHDVWQDIRGALNIISDTLSVRLTEIAMALDREDMLDEAYLSLKKYLIENGEAVDRVEEFVFQVKKEIVPRLKGSNMM